MRRGAILLLRDGDGAGRVGGAADLRPSDVGQVGLRCRRILPRSPSLRRVAAQLRPRRALPRLADHRGAARDDARAGGSVPVRGGRAEEQPRRGDVLHRIQAMSDPRNPNPLWENSSRTDLPAILTDLVTSIHEHGFCARCLSSSKPGGEGVIVVQASSSLLVALYEGARPAASRAMAAVDRFSTPLSRKPL